MKTSYWRNLPHFQPVGAKFFVTFRLCQSIPKKKLLELKSEYDIARRSCLSIKNEEDRNEKLVKIQTGYVRDYDLLLHNFYAGPQYLREDEIAEIVYNELFRWDQKLYDLLCFCIMSNHVHILIDTSYQLRKVDLLKIDLDEYIQLDQIMKRIKGATATYCNRKLKRKGQFWERESFDIYIRNEKMLQNVVAYILNNPGKAGLVTQWEDYKWNYLKTNGSTY